MKKSYFAVIIFLIISTLLIFADETYDFRVATRRGQLNKVTATIEGGVDVDQFDPDCNTPLCYAIKYNQIETVQYLINKGAYEK